MTRVACRAVILITERCALFLLVAEFGAESKLLVPLLALCFAAVGVRDICLKIPGVTLMIYHHTRSPRGPGLHSQSDDLPFPPWLPATGVTPQSMTGICYGH